MSKSLLKSLLAACCLVIGTHAAGAQVTYVDPSAVGANDGSSWTNAFVTLQRALDVAASGGTIRVADGTYLPSKLAVAGKPRSATFALVNGVTMIGGYAGAGAPNPDARDIVAHPSILSGDIGVLGSDADNSQHILSGSGLGSGTVLDGFTIRDGRATDATLPVPFGGAGLLLSLSNPVIRSCTFQDDWGTGSGGAVSAAGGSPTLLQCSFTGNKVLGSGDGGAVTAINATLTGCQFTSNSVLNGTGGALRGDNLTLTDCAFAGNHVENGFSGSISATGLALTRCTFVNESSSAGAGSLGVSGTVTLDQCNFTNCGTALKGGAALVQGAVFTATDCTFQDGFAGGVFASGVAGKGGAIYASSSTVRLTNCRLSGNEAGEVPSAAGRGGALYLDGGSAVVANCLFSGNKSWAANTASSGGAIDASGVTPQLNQCTFAGNLAMPSSFGASTAGGISGDCVLSNCVLWGNTDGSGSGQGAQVTGGVVTVNNSCIQGLTGSLGGAGNIGGNPLFVDADGADNLVGTPDDDLHLGAGSPCTDAGSVFLVPLDTVDLDGDGNTGEKLPLDLDRIGRFADDLSVADTGPGPAPDIDMGAYERSPWKNLGHALAGTLGQPVFVGGGTLQAGAPVILVMTRALPSVTSFLCIGATASNVPFKGGVLVPNLAGPHLVQPVAINAQGIAALLGFWPAGIPSGTTFYYQEWFHDAQGPVGFAASNGISGTTP